MTQDPGKKRNRGTRARSVARKLVMQALYQWQMTGQSAADINLQFLADEESDGADQEYFTELLTGCVASSEQIKAVLKPVVDRPVEQLDPVELAILMIGAYELLKRTEIPYRVVINEGVDLCKRFGATDAHKYVNAVLDRAAREIRTAETK
ncbi:transcription antitermination factor NusB [Povalibacter sp.]|uniref:transcription antitermination factor NusB n=1 Tax=Povalibacter sp. TaxID=1962978 RepID=UPI002F428F79